VDSLSIQSEIDQFLEETEDNYKKTGFPICPISLCHICLPFTPICCLCYCAHKREKGVDEAIANFNQRVEANGKEKGHVYMDLNEDYKLQRQGYFNARTERHGRNTTTVRVIGPDPKFAVDIRVNMQKQKAWSQKKGMTFETPVTVQPTPLEIMKFHEKKAAQHMQQEFQAEYANPPGLVVEEA